MEDGARACTCTSRWLALVGARTLVSSDSLPSFVQAPLPSFQKAPFWLSPLHSLLKALQKAPLFLSPSPHTHCDSVHNAKELSPFTPHTHFAPNLPPFIAQASRPTRPRKTRSHPFLHSDRPPLCSLPSLYADRPPLCSLPSTHSSTPPRSGNEGVSPGTEAIGGRKRAGKPARTVVVSLHASIRPSESVTTRCSFNGECR